MKLTVPAISEAVTAADSLIGIGKKSRYVISSAPSAAGTDR
jgi:hypothetical protein